MKIRTGYRSGSALPATLITAAVMAVTLTAYLSLVGFQNSLTHRSLTWNSTIPVVEAGIEEALTHVYHVQEGDKAVNGWTLVNSVYRKERTLTNGVYYVAQISSSNPPVIECTGYSRIPSSGKYVSRRVRVTTVKAAGMKGMVAKGKVTVKDLAQVDSYDSTSVLYSTNGQYTSVLAKDRGFVGTNSKLANDMELTGSTKIKGNVATGPGGVLKIDSPAVVGDKVFVANGANGGQIQAGHKTDDMNISFPDVTAPFASGFYPTSGSYNGTNYDYVVSDGNYKMGDLKLDTQKMVVKGNASLVVDNTLDISSAGFIYIAPGASLKIYVKNATAIGGQGIVNANSRPETLTLYGLPSNTQVYLSSSSRFIGTIYAPQAKLDISGVAEFCGASTSAEIVLHGSSKFHYDESLGGGGALGVFTITAWNEI